MRRLSIGKQNFEELIVSDLVYVDKTKQIHNIVEQGNLYFLARPRRFGKSLLVSLFSHLFQGKKSLFENLAIGKTDYEFESYPILKFNFSEYGYKVENLEAILIHEVEKYAQQYEVKIDGKSLGSLFKSLIENISKKVNKPVVLLIDEYDKPIIDFLTDLSKAVKNRGVLKTFFSPLKELDVSGHIRFLFITGVSKFSKVSLFSDLNNLKDLSLAPIANDLLGITHDELVFYFKDYIEVAAQKMNISTEELLGYIKIWYNGYSYDGEIKLYNPFSIINFFFDFRFRNYWFDTGTPTFLVETIRDKGVNPKSLEKVEVDESFFSNFSLENLDIVGLLYQTGYLTIKSLKTRFFDTRYILGYPNLEVKNSMLYNLTKAFTFKKQTVVSSTVLKMQEGLEEGKVDLFVTQLKVLLSDISYHLHPKNNQKDEEQLFKMWEGYFQTIIYLVTSYMGMYVQTEVTKHKGRLDLIAQTADFLYLMEFKLDGTSTNAIEQIKNRNYAAAYRNATQKTFLVGINFSKEERNVDTWEWEVWEN